MAHILLMGLDPAALSFSAESGLNAKNVNAAGNAANEALIALGHEVQTCLLHPSSTEAPLVEILSRNAFDCIMIGAGLRALPEYTIIFEKVINAIHQHAPLAKICFNTHPTNTVEAVLRWIE